MVQLRLTWITFGAVVLNTVPALAFPAYGSLSGGLAGRQVEDTVATSGTNSGSGSGSGARVPPPPPPPLTFTGAKLVDDARHQFRAPGRDDIRGPCPGLNTLANHGYLPRDGVATPAQIITAVQEGFNMEPHLARFTTYAAHLLDGNPVTDLLSIGRKTRKTGPDPPNPAIVGGINNHGTFEGDASMTRADAFFGDNFSFNPALFEQFKNFSNTFGGGFYNLTVAQELRFHRIQESIGNNPEFNIIGFRHLTLYAEASFPITLFVDGRRTGVDSSRLDLNSAESFFKNHRFPRGFFRASKPSGSELAGEIFAAHPTVPGKNVAGVNTFTQDDSMGSLLDFCLFYTQFANVTLKKLYPNPTGVLRRNININLNFFYQALVAQGSTCPQAFPYGQN